MDRELALFQCETVAEVAALLADREGSDGGWQTYLMELLDRTGLSYGRFAARCGLSKNTVRRWRLQGGSPRSRDAYLKVGFGAALEPEAVSRMLSYYGGYGGLNPRDPFDACCLFCLGRRARGDLRYDYAAAEALYHRLGPEAPPEGRRCLETTVLLARLSAADTEADLAAFLRTYGPELTGRKEKLERYLSEYLTVHRLEAARSGGGSLHSLGLPAPVEKQLSLLKCHGILPRRRTLTALGLHLNMTLEELTGCYQIFVTGGLYVKPYTYTKVTDMEGNIVLEKDTTQVRVVSEETATVLNRLLQTVVTQGTGARANLKGETGIVTAGKTGSSTGVKYVNGTQVDINNPDLWFIGFTPYYIGGVWMGYDIQEEIYYSTYPTPIFWKNLMLPIHEGLEAKDFTYSDKVQALQYCTESGDLATENCPSTATGWYKETYIPSTCILHRGGSSSSAVQEDEDNPVNEGSDSSSSSSDSDSGSSSGSGSSLKRPESNSGRDEDSGSSFWDSVSGLFNRG